MPLNCIVKLCRNLTKKQGISYHRFPSNPTRLETWRGLLQLREQNITKLMIILSYCKNKYLRERRYNATSNATSLQYMWTPTDGVANRASYWEQTLHEGAYAYFSISLLSGSNGTPKLAIFMLHATMATNFIAIARFSRLLPVVRFDMDRFKNINEVDWKIMKGQGLSLKHSIAIPRTIADIYFAEIEKTIKYFTGDLATVKMFGKVIPIPRQLVAYSDPGISYSYSGVTVTALPWPDAVQDLRHLVKTLTGLTFNFVLVNRYRNGNDYIGEHRDNEPELDPNYPIVSVSFGQQRTFVLKHKDSRNGGKSKGIIKPVKLELEHGSFLVMLPPTNELWYHSLPARKGLLGPRVNFTFRKHLQFTN